MKMVRFSLIILIGDEVFRLIGEVFRRDGEVLGDLIKISQLANELSVHINTVRRWADAGTIPSVRSPGGQRLFNLANVKAALPARNKSNAQLAKNEETLNWTAKLPLENLSEDVVWRKIKSELDIDTETNSGDIISIAFLEMLNNAIDHSSGTTVAITAWFNDVEWGFEITDDGIGVYENVRTGFGLKNVLESIGELTKGKQTTAPKKHSGEGIFFTSKSVDHFILEANNIRWEVNNLINDFTFGMVEFPRGTRVTCKISAHTSRKTIDIFQAFTVDHDFVKTTPTVKLFESGLSFISRSEARRLLKGLEKFTIVELDFRKVELVGQGFVDEIFRVWKLDHPEQIITPINMSPSVEFMIRRGIPKLKE